MKKERVKIKKKRVTFCVSALCDQDILLTFGCPVLVALSSTRKLNKSPFV